MSARSLRPASARFRTIKLRPKDLAPIRRQGPAVIRLTLAAILFRGRREGAFGFRHRRGRALFDRADLGGDVLALSPADFGKLIADDTEKWAKVVKSAGINRRDPFDPGRIFRNVR